MRATGLFIPWLVLFPLPPSLGTPVADRPDKGADLGLPKGAEHWDRIGDFKLRDGGKERLVKLYYRDTDSISERAMKEKGFATYVYPNSFALHAVYQDDAGKWVHREVYGAARVRFLRVQKTTPEAVVLQLRRNFLVMVRPGDDSEKVLGRGAEINKPFTLALSFQGGVLTAK
jgi:hypothetical protein